MSEIRWIRMGLGLDVAVDVDFAGRATFFVHPSLTNVTEAHTVKPEKLAELRSEIDRVLAAPRREAGDGRGREIPT